MATEHPLQEIAQARSRLPRISSEAKATSSVPVSPPRAAWDHLEETCSRSLQPILVQAQASRRIQICPKLPISSKDLRVALEQSLKEVKEESSDQHRLQTCSEAVRLVARPQIHSNRSINHSPLLFRKLELQVPWQERNA